MIEDQLRAGETVVEARGITKRFGAEPVLSGVNLELRAGEVVALAGENGAGKSTLLKIVAGMVSPTHGELVVDGVVQGRRDVRDATAQGIAIIPQELAPVPDLAIYENVFLGRELTTRIGSLDRATMIQDTRERLLAFGLTVDPRTRMRSLSTATQQLVEIIKATSSGCRVLLLDEPTSAISPTEAKQLFAAISDLRATGVTMIYTTHKMHEMRAVADRVVILRDGVLIDSKPLAEISDEGIVEAMIGRELGGLYPQIPAPESDDPLIEIRDLVVEAGLPPVSFSVRAGEFVALAGLMGAGRTELIETIFGLRTAHSGSVRVANRELRSRYSPSMAIRSGMALVPEDRKIGGAVLGMSILDNALIPRLNRFSRAGWILRSSARRVVDTVLRSVHLKFSGLGQSVDQLSGGNQQKVVIGRWLTDIVTVLLLDEPTRGVDVGARGEIYRLIADLAQRERMAIIFASSDMPEVIGLAHRVLVMRDHAIIDELTTADHTEASLQDRIFRSSAGLEPRGQE